MTKGKSSKPKGAKTAYACFLQEYREEQKNGLAKSLDFSEFSKVCSEKWKTLSAEEKKKYNDKSSEDKKRYIKEMENYEPEIDDKGKGNKKMKRKAKDPNKPKRPMSAFIFFSEEHRKSVREKNPEMKMGDVSKVLGGLWKDCKDKSKYEAMNAKDKERYEKEMKNYNSGASEPKKNKKAVEEDDEQDMDEEEEQEEVESEED